MDPIALLTADIRPIIPAGVKHRVLVAVAECFQASCENFDDPVALDGYLESRFEQLCNGMTVDLACVVDELMSGDRLNPSEAYRASAYLARELPPLGLRLKPLALELTAEVRERLDREVRETPLEKRRVARQQKVRIGDLLVEYGLISGEQLGHALGAQKRSGLRIGAQLVEMGAIAAQELAHFLSVQLGLRAARQDELQRVRPEIAALIPEALAAKHRAIPIAATLRTVSVAMVDPTLLDAVRELEFATGRRVEVCIALEPWIDAALNRLYGDPSVARLDDPWAEAGATDDFLLSDDRSAMLEPVSK